MLLLGLGRIFGVAGYRISGQKVSGPTLVIISLADSITKIKQTSVKANNQSIETRRRNHHLKMLD